MTRCTLTLRLEGPLSTAGLASAGHGVDQPFLRDHDGCMILAGTLVRGNVRHVLDAIAATAPDHLPADTVARWFGVASGSDDGQEAFASPEAWAPSSGTLRFGDLRAQNGAAATTITRIAVDEGTGSVVPGALQVLESPARPGEEVLFSGLLEAEPEALVWIERALRLVPA
ncbi:hypothetical protein, partial [Methylorubrum podarium]|uniref:hypothetical protein n=1 Tax=Methylorubrum podarium TaxID=200476 RepID=UPI001EE2FE75